MITTLLLMATLSGLATRFRQQMARLKITQQTLGKEAGISRRTLTNVLSGTSDYKVTTLLAVADRLGLEVVVVPKEAARGLEAEAFTPTEPKVSTAVQTALENLKRYNTPSDKKP